MSLFLQPFDILISLPETLLIYWVEKKTAAQKSPLKYGI